MFLQIITFADLNNWIGESDGTGEVKGMSQNPIIWIIFPEKTKCLPLTKWICFFNQKYQ